MYAATGGLHKHWPLTLRHWQDEEDRGSIASVMSESILLIVPSMDGLQTNPMYVSKPVCVCVCTVHPFCGLKEEHSRKNAAPVMTD